MVKCCERVYEGCCGVGEAVVGDELEGFIEDESLFTMEVK